MKHGKPQHVVAPAASMSVQTARKWQTGSLPLPAKVERTWRNLENARGPFRGRVVIRDPATCSRTKTYIREPDAVVPQVRCSRIPGRSPPSLPARRLSGGVLGCHGVSQNDHSRSMRRPRHQVFQQGVASKRRPSSSLRQSTSLASGMSPLAALYLVEKLIHSAGLPTMAWLEAGRTLAFEHLA